MFESCAASRGIPVCASTSRRTSSPTAAAAPCSRSRRAPEATCRGSSTTPRAPGRRSSSSRSRWSSSPTASRRRQQPSVTRSSGSARPLRGRRRRGRASRDPRRGQRRQSTWSSPAARCHGVARDAGRGLGRGAVVDAVRHPLLDPAAAIPIDLDLGPLRALVISGPNTGGKTVALKTLGLAALLHQSACARRPRRRRCRSSISCSRTSATSSRSR